MNLQARRPERNLSARFIAVCGSLVCGLSLTGCGSGVANLLPGAGGGTPAAGVPSGPVLGYVFSATDGTLRALLGVKGSSQVSASIVPAGTYVAGDTSTASSTALLEDATGALFAFNLPSAQPLRVAGGLPANAQIAFSASGKTAIAYSSSSIALITGLPSSPQVKTIAVPSGSAVSAVIVSDAGTIVMASGAAIGTLSTSGSFSRLLTVGAAGGFSFLPGTDDLLIADSAANTVSLLRTISTSPTSQPLNVAGLNKPVAVAASKDGKWAIVANGGDAGVLRVDLTSGTAAIKTLCSCQPSQLSSLSGGSVFRLNALYAGPLWTVDVASATPQMLFVPAINKGTP